MAVYKVPQDVEADDKLIGPFSFRQFIYLVIVVAAGGIAYFLSKLFLPLMIIPLPIILFFGALALPLRKDQPMETYLAALISFYLKPHKRLWNPDGIQTLVEITAPRVVEVQRTNGLTQDEAEQRLSYLASIVDSRGWAVRGVDAQQQALASSALTSDAFYAAQGTEDMLDESSSVGKDFESRLTESTERHHQQMLARMHTPQPSAPQTAPASVAQTPVTMQTPQPQAPQPPQPHVQPAPDDSSIHLTMNPYPTAMHQSVINPYPAADPVQPPTAQQTTSENKVSPDIMNLANNSDLSVETIAREAKRISEKKPHDDEVVISLR